MSFQDIFTDSFVESTTTLSGLQIVATIALSFLIGLFIFQIYKKTYQGIVYSKSFNTALVLMTMITSLVIMAVTSNIVLSLGMVGALSIVRFRTAVKDPLDVVFVFWAVAAGLVIGANFYTLGIFGSIVIGVILYVFNLFNSSEKPYLLVIKFSSISDEKYILNLTKRYSKKYVLRSKIVEKNSIELNIDIRFKEDEVKYVNELNNLESVESAVLVSNNEFSV